MKPLISQGFQVSVSILVTQHDRTALFGQDSEPGGSDAVSPVVQDHAGCLHGAENKHQCTEGSLTRSLGCLLSRALIKRLRVFRRDRSEKRFMRRSRASRAAAKAPHRGRASESPASVARQTGSANMWTAASSSAKTYRRGLP